MEREPVFAAERVVEETLHVDGAEEPLLTAPGQGKALPGPRKVTVSGGEEGNHAVTVNVKAGATVVAN